MYVVSPLRETAQCGNPLSTGTIGCVEDLLNQIRAQYPAQVLLSKEQLFAAASASTALHNARVDVDAFVQRSWDLLGSTANGLYVVPTNFWSR